MPEKVTPEMERTTEAPVRRAAQEVGRRRRSAGDLVALGLRRRDRHRGAVDRADHRPAGLLVPRTAAIKTTGWWTLFADPGAFTLDNYRQVLAPGTSASLGQYFVNSIVITIPSVMLPLFLASLAAYAFAWMPFPGRDCALRRGLRAADRAAAGGADPAARASTSASAWASRASLLERVAVAHDLRAAAGDLPAAQLHEGAPSRADRGGARRRRRARDDLLPDPAPAADAGPRGLRHLPVPLGLERPAGRAGVRSAARPTSRRSPCASPSCPAPEATDWHLLSAGAFVSMVVPLIVFLSLQRYFVRGLLAGGLKG